MAEMSDTPLLSAQKRELLAESFGLFQQVYSETNSLDAYFHIPLILKSEAELLDSPDFWALPDRAAQQRNLLEKADSEFERVHSHPHSLVFDYKGVQVAM